jgi:hypothetical protein
MPLRDATTFVYVFPKCVILSKKQIKEIIMGDFVVRLEGLKLKKGVEASINREIQSAVLRELAKVDLGGDFSARILKGELQGIYIRDKAFDATVGNLQVNLIKK